MVVFWSGDRRLKYQVDSGWLSGARRVPSPHCNSRPEDCPVDLLVIHSISLPPGQYGGPYIDTFFLGQLDIDAHPYFAEIAALQVSAHLLIDRDGIVTQYVPLDRRAWHAGKSEFRGAVTAMTSLLASSWRGWIRIVIPMPSIWRWQR